MSGTSKACPQRILSHKFRPRTESERVGVRMCKRERERESERERERERREREIKGEERE
jgi:hypothetical protein